MHGPRPHLQQQGQVVQPQPLAAGQHRIPYICRAAKPSKLCIGVGVGCAGVRVWGE